MGVLAMLVSAMLDLAILDSAMLLPLPLPFLLDASGSVRPRLSPRLIPPTWLPALATLVLATLPPLPTLDTLPPPCSLDASGSVRLRLRLRLTPPTWLPATDLATLVSVMPVSAMPVLATPTLAMPPLPTGTTCGNFGKSKVQSFSLRRHQQQRCKNMHVIPSDLE